MANWLNTAFYNFDRAFFFGVNSLAKTAGSFFTPFCEFISFFGKGGIFLIILSIVLMLFKNSRRAGATMLLAIGVGALFTNVILKNVIARPRPYTTAEYNGFWQTAGAHTEKELSFPSGHATVATASMTALFLTLNKKWSSLCFLFTLFTAFARVYLVVHYATDVIAGILVGAGAAVIAYFIVKKLFNFFGSKENKACAFILNADVLNLLNKKK